MRTACLRGLAPTLLSLALAACAAEPRLGPASIDGAGSPSRGLAYAQDACATCHAVNRGETLSPNPAAPAFQSVADTPGMTGLALRVWLQSPHPSMPNLIVDANRVDDLWAYISSLESE